MSNNVIDIGTRKPRAERDPDINMIVELVFATDEFSRKVKLLHALHVEKARAVMAGQEEIAAGIQRSIDIICKL